MDIFEKILRWLIFSITGLCLSIVDFFASVVRIVNGLAVDLQMNEIVLLGLFFIILLPTIFLIFASLTYFSKMINEEEIDTIAIIKRGVTACLYSVILPVVIMGMLFFNNGLVQSFTMIFPSGADKLSTTILTKLNSSNVYDITTIKLDETGNPIVNENEQVQLSEISADKDGINRKGGAGGWYWFPQLEGLILIAFFSIVYIIVLGMIAWQSLVRMGRIFLNVGISFLPLTLYVVNGGEELDEWRNQLLTDALTNTLTIVLLNVLPELFISAIQKYGGDLSNNSFAFCLAYLAGLSVVAGLSGFINAYIKSNSSMLNSASSTGMGAMLAGGFLATNAISAGAGIMGNMGGAFGKGVNALQDMPDNMLNLSGGLGDMFGDIAGKFDLLDRKMNGNDSMLDIMDAHNGVEMPNPVLDYSEMTFGQKMRFNFDSSKASAQKSTYDMNLLNQKRAVVKDAKRAY